MKGQIGVGLLIDDDSFNRIRELEMEIATITDNQAGLFQSPHLTIKRPVQIDQSKIAKYQEIVSLTLTELPKHKVTLNGPGYFGSSVIYLKPSDASYFQAVNEMLLNALKPLELTISEFDENFMPHLTLSMSQDKVSMKKFQNSQLSRTGISLENVDVSLGAIFMSWDDKHWIIIKKFPLKDS